MSPRNVGQTAEEVLLQSFADHMRPRDSQNDAFKKTYWDDPVAFAHDCILWRHGEGLVEYQDEVLDALALKKRVCIRGPHGLGKCKKASESIQLADGSLVVASDLVDKEFDVLAVDENLTTHVARARAFDNGVREIVKITTDRGRGIERTTNHPLWADLTPRRYNSSCGRFFLTPEGSWVEAGDLVEGSTIAVSYEGCPDTPFDISDDHIKLLGYMLGDGSITHNGPSFSQMPGKQIDEMKEIADRLGVRMIPDLPEGTPGCIGYTFRDKTPLTRRSIIIDVLKSWHIWGTNSHTKFFPAWVWRLDRRQLGLLLSRLYACDGWVLVDGEIGYCSVSERLIRDVHRAMLRLRVSGSLSGGPTSWTHNGIKKIGYAYTIVINTARDRVQFLDALGDIYGKEAKCEKLRENQRVDRMQRWRWLNLPQTMTWEKVARVERVGFHPTVGIEVDQYHTFLTDFVEHNTTVNAIATLWFALTRDAADEDWKVVTTAGGWRQLQGYLWPEIRKWARRIRWEKLGRPPLNERTELGLINLRLHRGQAFPVASNDHTLIEGAHADHILYIFDESKSIKANVFDAAEGALSIGSAYALATSTPGEPVGRFFEIQSRRPGYEDWWPRHVTQNEVIRAGRMRPDWAENRKRQWGEQSAIYQNRVLGEFAAADEDAIIPLSWVEAAVDRWAEWIAVPVEDREIPTFTCVGVDVARYGTDRTAIAVRHDNIIREIRTYSRQDTMQTTGHVSSILKSKEGGYAIVDVIGIGAGVVDRLRELVDDGELPYADVIAFNAAESTDITDSTGEIEFANKRAAAWWHMREMLDPGNEHNVMLPDNHDLMVGDLVTPKWKPQSGGKYIVESKDDIRKRLGITPESGTRSTDEGDSVVMAFWHGSGAPEGYSSEVITAASTPRDPLSNTPITNPRDRSEVYSDHDWQFGRLMRGQGIQRGR